MAFITTLLIILVCLAGLGFVAALWLIVARRRKDNVDRQRAAGAFVGVTNTADGWETITSLPYPSPSSSPNKFDADVACA